MAESMISREKLCLTNVWICKILKKYWSITANKEKDSFQIDNSWWSDKKKLTILQNLWTLERDLNVAFWSIGFIFCCIGQLQTIFLRYCKTLPSNLPEANYSIFTGCRSSSSRFVTINTSSMKPSIKVRNRTHYTGCFCFFQWYPPKKLKYGKPRLGESTLT